MEDTQKRVIKDSGSTTEFSTGAHRDARTGKGRIDLIPLEVASKYLGVSPRQLSKLIADGREPYASIGANIGTRQNYARIYTERMISYLSGNLAGV